MLYLPQTKFESSGDVAVAPGSAIAAEGVALTRAVGNPAAGVSASQGVATEVFCGFAIAGLCGAPFTDAYASAVEEFVVPANGIVSLQLAPVAGQFACYDVTAGALDTTDVVLTGKNIAGLTAGNTVRVTYRYAQTVTQARARQGDAQPGGYAGLAVGMVGCGKRGTVFTSEFDASVNWAAPAALKVGASGQVVAAGNGPTIPGFVVHVPTAEVPFLGIEFSAP